MPETQAQVDSSVARTGGDCCKGIPCRLMERGGGERQEAWYNELFQQLAQIAEPRAEPQ
jgi:hypothetical protein